MKKIFSLIALLLVIMFSVSSCTKIYEEEGSRIMLFSSNWGDDSIRMTDDINSLADGDTATPRIITGSNVPLPNPSWDSLAVDRMRNMVYVTNSSNQNIIVYHNVGTASGNIPPDRTITINTATSYLYGIAIDYTRDRLYVAGYNGSRCVFILNNASILNGSATANAILTVSAGAIFIDRLNDRLYVGKYLGDGLNGEVYVYDNASTLTTGATPDRTIEFHFVLSYALWVDAATDRLYYGSRNPSPDGYNLFIFDGASTLTGSYDPDDADATITLSNLVSVMVENGDRLYMWEDSATSVKIYNNASTLSGNVTAPPDKTIYGVVSSGYGMDYLAY